MSFTIFQNEKMPFQAIKTKSSNSRKIDIFPTFFFLSNIDQENVFYDILEQKMPFQAIKTSRSKSQKIDIFLKGITHGLGPKMAIFPTFFLKAIQTRKISFTTFQHEKMPFQAIKTRRLNSLKIDIFLKWLTHGFGPKMAIFQSVLFLSNIDQENVFYDVLERKNAFLGYQNKKFKQFKN